LFPEGSRHEETPFFFTFQNSSYLVSYKGSLWAVTADGEEGWGLFRWVPEPVFDDDDDDDDDFVVAVEGSIIFSGGRK